MNQFTITLVLLSIIIVCLIVIIIISCLFKEKHDKQMHEMIRRITDVNLNTAHITILSQQLNDQSNQLQELSESVNALSTTLTTVLNVQSTQQPSKLPTPEEEEQIAATIKDQITTEISLAAGLRSPYKDALKEIIIRTAETYPDINIEYIVRKTVSMIEMFSNN